MPQATAEHPPASEPPPRLLGRQPIFDAQERLIAYELLARRGPLDTDERQDHATDDVIEQVANLGGLGPITNHRPAFINLTRNALLSGRYAVLPRDRVVYELLEHVEPDREVVAACRKLRSKGYRLALDDVVDLGPLRQLLPLAQLVKVDFSLTDHKQWEVILHEAAKHEVSLLAEKVEVRDVFEWARDAGYHRFQGFFFEKPQLIARGDVSPSVAAYIRLLSEVTRDVVDFDKVEAILKSDLSLSTRLLRYLRNHADLVDDVSSIKQAVVMLGEEPLRRWAAVLGVTVLGDDKPSQLVTQSLQRAAFCESLAGLLDLHSRRQELFLLGLLSLLDSLTQRPLDEVLLDMPVCYDVRAGLLGGKTTLGRVLTLARACERGDEATVDLITEKLGVSKARVHGLYYQAIAWADAITSSKAA